MKRTTSLLLISIVCAFLSCSEIETQNRVPIAFAGFDRTVAINFSSPEEVELDGTGSYDPDSDVLTYNWQIEHIPKKSSLSKIANSDRPLASFIPDAEGDFIFSLVVSDGVFVSNKDIVVITIIKK
ncbi:MAG: PKD domain-containing protein [Deltaproteobacteria bacterium]|nr:PKD domain-containing protein [Deltaproteobacteria bacterium]